MVLIEIGELVVEKNGWLEGCGDVKLDDALSLLGDVGDGGVGGIVEERVTRGRMLSIMICCAELVRVLVRRHICELEVVERSCCGKRLALGIVKSDFRDARRAPDEETADGGEYNADEEEGGQHGLWGEDRLPGLETLLLEGGIWSRGERYQSDGGKEDILAGRLHPALSFLGSAESESSPSERLRLKSAMAVESKQPQQLRQHSSVSSLMSAAGHAFLFARRRRRQSLRRPPGTLQCPQRRPRLSRTRLCTLC